ncbi:unnamed protein product [Citrullus colocynthis]|uniref:Uncharacterized protein n=1 Tax=Citrullus colocynthis TaxID=252529 RepID=A0ABP0ZBG0_9ROSI
MAMVSHKSLCEEIRKSIRETFDELKDQWKEERKKGMKMIFQSFQDKTSHEVTEIKEKSVDVVQNIEAKANAIRGGKGLQSDGGWNSKKRSVLITASVARDKPRRSGSTGDSWYGQRKGTGGDVGDGSTVAKLERGHMVPKKVGLKGEKHPKNVLACNVHRNKSRRRLDETKQWVGQTHPSWMVSGIHNKETERDGHERKKKKKKKEKKGNRRQRSMLLKDVDGEEVEEW